MTLEHVTLEHVTLEHAVRASKSRRILRLFVLLPTALVYKYHPTSCLCFNWSKARGNFGQDIIGIE